MPGPDQDCYPIIGCCNPTGLLGKVPLLSQLPHSSGGSVWSVSETHLTRQGQSKLAKELKFHKVGLNMQMGAPVPARSSTVSAIGGKQRGVGFLSTTPNRVMTSTWPESLWTQSRIHAASFQFGHRTVQGAVVYGFAVQPETAATKQQTDLQCQAITHRMLRCSSGLRFIAGDFNQLDGGIDSMQEWATQGWVNIQKWAYDTHGQEIQPTCKQKTTKDHVFVSPELARYLKAVHIDNTIFSDHAVLWASFDSFGKPPLIPRWHQPSAIPWQDVPVNLEAQPCHLQGTASQRYASLCKQFETHVHHGLEAQGKRLPSQCKGRGQVFEVQWTQEYSKPPVMARQGEPQPEFHGVNLKHAQWMRQLRRLINLKRSTQVETTSASQRVHQLDLWRSIRKGSGFAPDFVTWWTHHSGCQHPITLHVPAPEALHSMSECFEAHLRSFEKQLMRARITQARQRRVDDPNVIFHDLKADAPAPVQMLLDHTKATVDSTDAEQSAVIAKEVKTWDNEAPVRIGKQVAHVIHADHDTLWVDPFPDCVPGDPIVQDKPVGDLQEMFARFGKEWQTRWDKHLHTPDQRWDDVVEFANRVLPNVPPMTYARITREEWLQAVRRKRKRAAPGPDAMTREDLLRMPPQLIDALLDILHQAEQQGLWPSQMLEGFVIALEKVPGATDVKQFRPITIFSICYRTWASIRAKQILQHLAPLAPERCAGNLPGKSAGHVWHGILLEIEMAQMNSTPLSGAVLDLEKAFNTLPRLPVFAIMAKLHVPSPVLRAWAAALAGMSRRFKLLSAVGPSIRSTTGFAEGCSLSVTAMVALNLLAHQWVRLKTPNVHLWSYVDNLELVAQAGEQLLQGLGQLEHYCQALDLSIDTKKTYTWSIQAEDRKTFRNHDLATKLQARDLGGHVQYSKVVSNSTITSRCAQIKPLWGRLSRSLAPYKTKIRAIKAKAWPHCLHGVASVHMSDDHFVHLRTGAMQGLGEHSAGTSPLIHMSLVEHPTLDPQFVSIWNTVLIFRRQPSSEEDFQFAMQQLHAPSVTYIPRPGPHSVLLVRLHQVAWQWHQGTHFLDQHGWPCDVLNCSVQEIFTRIVGAWQDRAQATGGLRKTLQGLSRMSPSLTLRGMGRHTPEEQALLRVCLNGTFCTADRQKHHEGTTNPEGACKYCGQPDSPAHRHLECPEFARCRQLTAEQLATLAQLPPCVSSHGWVPEPPTVRIFKQKCLEVQDHNLPFELPPNIPDTLFVFTDGACECPAQPESRWAAWGLVLADLHQDTFHPVASGLLPGWVQTSLRAEIMAALKACHLALELGKPLYLWTDNNLVFNRLRAFQQAAVPIHPMQKDADLWKELQFAVRALGPQLAHVSKVVSHQHVQGACTEYEAWVYRGNNAADATASAVFSASPTLPLWNQLRRDLTDVLLLRDQLHAMLISIGKAAVKAAYPSTRPDAATWQPRIRPEDVQEVAFPDVSVSDLSDKLAFAGVDALLQWLPTVCTDRDDVQYISWFQLNMLYEHQTGAKGFEYNCRKRQWSVATPATTADFARRTNWLSKLIRNVMEEVGHDCQAHHLRPKSQVIQFWTMTVPIRISPDNWNLSETLLADQQAQLRSVGAVRGLS